MEVYFLFSVNNMLRTYLVKDDKTEVNEDIQGGHAPIHHPRH